MNTLYSVRAARLLRSIVLKVVPEYGKKKLKEAYETQECKSHMPCFFIC